jgi:hypothetical protein
VTRAEYYLDRGEHGTKGGYRFSHTCVDTPESDVPELSRMIGEAVDISRGTFMQHCGESAREVFRQLGYAGHPKQGLTAAADFHISYHRDTWYGKRCYFFRWSAIEHIFI